MGRHGIHGCGYFGSDPTPNPNPKLEHQYCFTLMLPPPRPLQSNSITLKSLWQQLQGLLYHSPRPIPNARAPILPLPLPVARAPNVLHDYYVNDKKTHFGTHSLHPLEQQTRIPSTMVVPVVQGEQPGMQDDSG